MSLLNETHDRADYREQPNHSLPPVAERLIARHLFD